MRMSNLYMPTLREVPSEAEIPSHKLLFRAGMARKMASGVYSYLPLGYRVVRKIEQIIRKQMDEDCSQELLMPIIQSKELWQSTGRWEEFEREMFRLRDRNDREYCLGFSNEEHFVKLIKNELKSYKQLPMNLYQIQTRYRDAEKPGFGLVESREFITKDACSFDIDEKGLEVAYENMWESYEKIFDKLKLDYRVVRRDTGAMLGKVAHEFIVVSDSGDNLFAHCNDCDYAATDQKAEVSYKVKQADNSELKMEKVHTPGVITIDALASFFKVNPSNFAKALVFTIKDNEPVVVIIPGDRELNETKICNYLGIGIHDIEMADENIIVDITGANKGFTGPVNLKKEVRVIVDSRITQIKNLVVGGNETNYHIKNVNYGRDFEGEIAGDLLLVEEGDICPQCDGKLKLGKGIGVGNMFQIGTKYSDLLDASYLDKNGKANPFFMGSYSINVSRSMPAIVEQFHDEDGIKWPLNIAPYEAIITIINIKNEEQKLLGERLYDILKSWGMEVLLDDRKERAGVKFKDRDLIGIPIRIIVGKRAGENIVEYSIRGGNQKIEVKEDELKALMSEVYEEYDMSLK